MAKTNLILEINTSTSLRLLIHVLHHAKHKHPSRDMGASPFISYLLRTHSFQNWLGTLDMCVLNIPTSVLWTLINSITTKSTEMNTSEDVLKTPHITMKIQGNQLLSWGLLAHVL